MMQKAWDARPSGESRVVDVYELLEEIDEAGHLEARRKDWVDDLMVAYDLDAQEAEDLHYLIQRPVDPELVALPAIDACDPAVVHECIVEGFDAGLDGWTSHEQAVITRYIDDLRRYCAAAKTGA